MRNIFIVTVILFFFVSLSAEESKNVVRAAFFPVHEAVLSARADSVLCPIKLRTGSAFKSGEILLELDSSRYRIEKERCQELYDFARFQFEDKRALREKNLTSDFELMKAKHELIMSASALAEANLNLSFCIITAPFDGKIAEIMTHDFETVRPGQPLLRIIDDHELLAVINPPLTWALRKKIGDKANLRLSNGQTVEGTIYEIAPAADNRTETVRVKIKVNNAEGNFCAGMTGDLIYGN